MWIALLFASAPMEIAVTVDDLPRHEADHPQNRPAAIAEAMLRVLVKHKVPQVYGFINHGRAKKEDAAVYEKWKEAGYPLGNHTFDHVDIEKVSVETFIANIDENAPFITSKVFRYPYLREGGTLETRRIVRKALFERGYRIAQVTIEPYDWSHTPPYQRCLERKDEVTAAIVRESFLHESWMNLRWSDVESRRAFGRPIKHVLLLHLGKITADTLEDLLTEYEKAGAKWISLDEAMRDPLYAEDPDLTPGNNFLSQLFRARGIDATPRFHVPREVLNQLCR